jgi:hypothetical protein
VQVLETLIRTYDQMHENVTNLPIWSTSVAGCTLRAVADCDDLVDLLELFLGADSMAGGPVPTNALSGEGPAAMDGSTVDAWVNFFCEQHCMISVIEGSPSKTFMVPCTFQDLILFRGTGR